VPVRLERERRSRAEVVAGDVENEILEARLPVGAHLGRRAEFMNRFGISPTIMNETLRILRDSGLVRVRSGPGGGVFVASLPPQVRLGAIDLWFTHGPTHPLDLFEARVHLEEALTPVAFVRADDRDVAAMSDALDQMARVTDARAYLEGVMRLHRVVVSAARVPVLDGMHQSVVAILQASLTRAVFIEGHQPMLTHSLAVHQGLVDAFRSRDRDLFAKIMRLHHEDLIRTDDPRRSPARESPD
jgi:DNA-binding FadR family transcriptional regulator